MKNEYKYCSHWPLIETFFFFFLPQAGVFQCYKIDCLFYVNGLLVPGTGLTAPETKVLSFYQQNRFSEGVRNISFPHTVQTMCLNPDPKEYL